MSKSDWMWVYSPDRTAADMADDLGISKDAMRTRLYRAGLPYKHGSKANLDITNIRRKVDDMSPLDAVNYLLGILEALAVTQRAGHPVDDAVKIAGNERAMLVMLYDANGAFVPHDAIVRALWPVDEPKVPYHALTVLVHNIRKKIPESWRLLNNRGVGYALVREPKNTMD